MNTRFNYMYRDGGNNKREGSVIFAGEPRDINEEHRTLHAFMDDEQFMAHQLGVPEIFLWDPNASYDPEDTSTYPADIGPGKYCISDDDHCWHEFVGLELTEEPPTDPRHWSEFRAVIVAITQWQPFEPSTRKTVKPRTCSDDCDAPHCKKCGCHYDPACGQGGVCDGCLVDRASSEAEAVTKAFGGDAEAAARHMGW